MERNIFLADSTNDGFTNWKITTIPMVTQVTPHRYCLVDPMPPFLVMVGLWHWLSHMFSSCRSVLRCQVGGQLLLCSLQGLIKMLFFLSSARSLIWQESGLCIWAQYDNLPNWNKDIILLSMVNPPKKNPIKYPLFPTCRLPGEGC